MLSSTVQHVKLKLRKHSFTLNSSRSSWPLAQEDDGFCDLLKPIIPTSFHNQTHRYLLFRFNTGVGESSGSKRAKDEKLKFYKSHHSVRNKSTLRCWNKNLSIFENYYLMQTCNITQLC